MSEEQDYAAQAGTNQADDGTGYLLAQFRKELPMIGRRGHAKTTTSNIIYSSCPILVIAVDLMAFCGQVVYPYFIYSSLKDITLKGY
ncbi:hypothetical protein HO173_010358 [Letharia columbiana]|uniref:Uncharacterized protein n=1 Tax=Letharia columbiana TaxID=112416 RepID=A0A8H6FMR3_9LECA|nr:uncharacterized protein HO173_010358 [Letharia columbiana]KAF6231398.1 hypothetical protein HO173_010358 [Letharia columbiana]